MMTKPMVYIVGEGVQEVDAYISTPQYPLGTDLIWYEVTQTLSDLDTMRRRIDYLGKNMRKAFDNQVQANTELLNAVNIRDRKIEELTAELAALKKE